MAQSNKNNKANTIPEYKPYNNTLQPINTQKIVVEPL